MLKKICVVCKKEFFVYPSRSSAKYCSKKCMTIGMRASSRICPVCGKVFWVPGNPTKRNVFCSRKCSGVARRTGKIIKCKYCGKEVYKYKYAIEKSTDLFCSLVCANEYQGRNKLEFKCKTCGKLFKWSKSRIKENNPTYCSMSCRNKDEEWVKKASISSNMAQYKKKGLNNLEKTGNEILKKLNIDFYNQFSINDKFLVDVFIPIKNVVIQWDGDYWHGYPSKLNKGKPDKRQKQRMRLDISQDAYMKKCGYKVLRFWEHDVYENRDQIKERIIEVIN